MKSGSWLSIRALCLAPGPARRSGEEGRTLPLLLSPGSGRNCVSGTPATAFPLLSPCLQRVGDVAVERDRSQLVGLATHAQVHRAALVVCWPLPERVGRQAAQLVGAQPGAADGLDDREVTDGRGGGGALASGAEDARAGDREHALPGRAVQPLAPGGGVGQVGISIIKITVAASGPSWWSNPRPARPCATRASRPSAQ